MTLLFIVLPLLAGAYVYFAVFHAAAWRTGPPAPLFLPLSGMRPPLKPYELFSVAHLADFPNALLQVLLPAAALLAGVLWLARRQRPWADPRWFALASGLILLLVFFFSANTSLSPPRDWDLYALLMPPCLFLLAATVKWVPTPQRAGALLVVLVSIPFSISSEVVNWTAAGLTPRLADLATHVYDTYYIGTGQILNTAAQIGVDRQETARLVRAAAERMQPVTSGPDPEYSQVQFVLCQIAWEAGQADRAADHLAKSVEANPEDISTLMRAASFYEVLGMQPRAREYLRTLIAREPGNLEIWKSFVRLECGSGGVGGCLDAVHAALVQFPANTDFADLERMIRDRQAQAGPSSGPAQP